MLPPDPADRLHNQHPPTTRSHPRAGSLPTTTTRGSKLDADHPATGVNVPRPNHTLPLRGGREGRYWLIGDVTTRPGRSLFVRLEGAGQRQGRRRQMDRRHHPRAWRSPGPDRREPATGPPARRLRRSPILPQPATTRAGPFRTDGPRQRRPDRRNPHDDYSPWPSRFRAQSPKPICADAALRLCTAPEPCASTHAATIGRMPRPRPRPGRR